jgi:uncharacterized protein YbcI
LLSLPTSICRDDRSGGAPSGASGPLVEIANAIVHVYKDAFGRGPTKARARFADTDTLVVLLEDIMTVAERNLLELGEVTHVHEHRLFLQLALEDRKRVEVERILERRTLASVCGVDPTRDLAAEIFTLEPSVEARVELRTTEPLGQIPERQIG